MTIHQGGKVNTLGGGFWSITISFQLKIQDTLVEVWGEVEGGRAVGKDCHEALRLHQPPARENDKTTTNGDLVMGGR